LPARRQLLASLVDAYTVGATVAIAWSRPSAGAPLRVLVGHSAAAPSKQTRHTLSLEMPLLYPPGGRGRAVPSQTVLAELGARGMWLRCEGVPAWPSMERDESLHFRAAAPFEEIVAYLAGQAFAWLVLAEPCPERDLTQALTDAEADVRAYERASWKLEQLEAERAEARYRELVQARVSGAWWVHVLVGADSDEDARRTGALLSAAADLAMHAFALRPVNDVPSGILEVFVSQRRGTAPFLATTDVLASIARPPEHELPGVRLQTPPAFDTAPEPPPTEPLLEPVDRYPSLDSNGLVVGTVLDEFLQPAEQFVVSARTLLRHTFVCGATGSGKSQSIRTLLEGLARSEAPIPWLVLEPAKREYAVGLAGRLRDIARVHVLRPGEPRHLPVSLNPLEPAPGFLLQSHIDLVRALFLAAFDAEEPFPQIIVRALDRCYTRRGWDLALSRARPDWVAQQPGTQPSYPTLRDLQRACREVVEEVGYSERVRDDVRGFVDVRIGSLRLGSPGRFFEGGHPLDFAQLLRQHVVLEGENLTNDQDQAFLIGAVVIRLFEHLRAMHAAQLAADVSFDDEVLRHVIVVEEAHRLLKNVASERAGRGAGSAHAVELFAGLLAEIRAYGEGIIIAEQIPSKIIPDVIKNTALKLVHRLPSADDRLALGATMNLTPEQSEYVVTLRPGAAAVFADGMDRPLLTAIPNGKAREFGAVPVQHPPLSQEGAGRRFAGCGRECRGRPCDLAEMRAGEELATDPHLLLWVEVALVAHVLGEPHLGRPRPGWLADTRRRLRLERRTVECAFAGLAQAAVESRYPFLVDFFRPEDLAMHLAAATVHDYLQEAGPHPCGAEDWRWQAGRRRFHDVLVALQDDVATGGGPHPLTDNWRRERSLDLRGTSSAEQLDNLRRHPVASYPHQRALLRGTDEPPPFQRAADMLSSRDEPLARLDGALTDMLSAAQARWLVDRIA
jgi:hypothetical protein